MHLIIPFAPGGGSDLTGRLVAESMSSELGQPVVVESKPGAGSAVGIDYVAKSRPDGYNIVWATSALTINQAIRSDVPYDVPDDFSYIAHLIAFPRVVAVNPQLPVNSLAELIEYAKANPGSLRAGTAGIGSGPHLGGALFAGQTGIEIEHIPYQGAGPSVAALLSGEVEIVFGAPTSIKPHYDAGTVRVLAVTDTKRHPSFEDVPTLAEVGVADAESWDWWGLLAPAGLPSETLEKLRDAAVSIAADETFNTRLNDLGYSVDLKVGDEFEEFVIKDMETWRDVSRRAGIAAE